MTINSPVGSILQLGQTVAHALSLLLLWRDILEERERGFPAFMSRGFLFSLFLRPFTVLLSSCCCFQPENMNGSSLFPRAKAKGKVDAGKAALRKKNEWRFTQWFYWESINVLAEQTKHFVKFLTWNPNAQRNNDLYHFDLLIIAQENIYVSLIA